MQFHRGAALGTQHRDSRRRSLPHRRVCHELRPGLPGGPRGPIPRPGTVGDLWREICIYSFIEKRRHSCQVCGHTYCDIYASCTRAHDCMLVWPSSSLKPSWLLLRQAPAASTTWPTRWRAPRRWASAGSHLLFFFRETGEQHEQGLFQLK